MMENNGKLRSQSSWRLQKYGCPKFDTVGVLPWEWAAGPGGDQDPGGAINMGGGVVKEWGAGRKKYYLGLIYC